MLYVSTFKITKNHSKQYTSLAPDSKKEKKKKTQLPKQTIQKT